ncbi:MAG TPA: hypothetical protein P5234_08125 [Thermoanaerobaculaceae bacterium]|nr:hypothetical protein [Thermoanaerobaculaceae bacterium]HRS16205.1 hypothetical protein [Thermoanaerobaculaceae bacterium]
MSISRKTPRTLCPETEVKLGLASFSQAIQALAESELHAVSTRRPG